MAHPLFEPLVGTWRGHGEGTFPGMPAFAYEEEIRFEDLGGDVAYFQRAWDPERGMVLHAEAGIWRATGDDAVVASIAQARRNEVSAGTVRDGLIQLASTATSAADDVKPVTASRRWYRIDGVALSYEYAMAAGDMTEPVRHLAGTLRRSEGVRG
jgi:hypothetical protein